jgi:hypothetical protein
MLQHGCLSSSLNVLAVTALGFLVKDFVRFLLVPCSYSSCVVCRNLTGHGDMGVQKLVLANF